MTPKQIPTKAIVSTCSVEAVLPRQHELSESTKDNIIRRVTSTLQSASLSNSNLTLDEQKALKLLKTDENIVIRSTDRGQVNVSMNKTDWLTTNRPTKYLNDTRHPHCNAKLTANVLLTLKKADKIDFRCYNRLRYSVPQLPKLYALLKLHKHNIPMWPIVSFCGSTT